MLEKPQITRTTAQTLAIVHETVPRAQIVKVMRPGLDELRSAVAAQGIAVTGPWLTHHLRMDPDVFDFEICVPVAAPIVAAGRARPGQWPAAWVARTVYHGGFEGLGAAWGEFLAWIASEGHATADDLWEVYLAGPESGDDPTKWRTQLTKPLVR